jgi:hypothetical protein
MFEGFAYIAVALVGGYGALTGYLPAMLISLFGDRTVLTVSNAPSIGYHGILSPGSSQPSTSSPGPSLGIPGAPPPLIAGITTGFEEGGNQPSYTGEPLGPGGPVITGTQDTGSNQESEA